MHLFFAKVRTEYPPLEIPYNFWYHINVLILDKFSNSSLWDKLFEAINFICKLNTFYIIKLIIQSFINFDEEYIIIFASNGTQT